jgi:hypothetical protein
LVIHHQFNFSPTPSIYSMFSRKVPWAMYFAEDFNTANNVLPNYISNGRDATMTGTITKTTDSGNGATGNINIKSGGTGATVDGTGTWARLSALKELEPSPTQVASTCCDCLGVHLCHLDHAGSTLCRMIGRQHHIFVQER